MPIYRQGYGQDLDEIHASLRELHRKFDLLIENAKQYRVYLDDPISNSPMRSNTYE